MRITDLKFFCLLFLILCSEYIFSQSWSETTKPNADSLVTLLKNANTDDNKLNILSQLTNIAFNKTYNDKSNNWDPVINYANACLKLAEKLNDKKVKLIAINTLGMVAKNKGNYTESLQEYFSSLKIAEEINDKSWICDQNFSIGRIYSDIDNNTEALKYLLQAEKMAKEYRLMGPKLMNYHRFTGVAYHRSGNYQEALKYFFEAIDAGNKAEVPHATGIIYRYIGNVYKDMGDYKEALKYHMDGLINILETKKRIGDSPMEFYDYLGLYYTDIGTVFNKQANRPGNTEAGKDYTQAITYLNKGLSIAEQIKDKLTTLSAYLGLSEAYKGIDDSRNSLLYLTRYLHLKDSMLNIDFYTKMSDVKAYYEIEKARLEDKAEQEKIKTENRLQINLLLMGLILAIVISVFLMLFLPQRNQKKRAVEKAETVHQMAELEMQSLRSQLNPHFIFNSLNSIQTLILKEETDKSQSYLSQFARLLRMLLENTENPFIPLWKEIDFLQLYLALESLRVPDMLYSISTDPALNTEQILIPNMFLQPYVENAIWHGLSHKETDKQLQIRIYSENGTVNYEIEDNGVGRKKAGELKSFFGKQHQSKGMELLSKRIKLLNKEYSSAIQTEVADVMKNNEVAGTLVTIKVPLKLSEPSQS